MRINPLLKYGQLTKRSFFFLAYVISEISKLISIEPNLMIKNGTPWCTPTKFQKLISTFQAELMRGFITLPRKHV